MTDTPHDRITRRDALMMAGAAAGSSLLSGRSLFAADGGSLAQKGKRPALAIFSRHLQWASAEEAIEVASDSGFSGIGWTVRNGAHVEPKNVARDLPRIVELTHRAGLGTPLIATELTGADAPFAEAIVETAAGLGIHRYGVETPRYDRTQELATQLDGMRPTIEALVRLNERHGSMALFHTHAGIGKVGGAVWDLWLLLRDFDPKRVAINYDTGLGPMGSGLGWNTALRFVHRHIGSLSLKDYRWQPPAQSGGISEPQICQPGEGVINFKELLGYFQSTGYDGPAEVQFEYPIGVPGRAGTINLMNNLAVGKWKLEMQKSDLVALLKRDADFYAARFLEVGLRPASGLPPA